LGFPVNFPIIQFFDISGRVSSPRSPRSPSIFGLRRLQDAKQSLAAPSATGDRINSDGKFEVIHMVKYCNIFEEKSYLLYLLVS
jgi:hypothetical protein